MVQAPRRNKSRDGGAGPLPSADRRERFCIWTISVFVKRGYMRAAGIEVVSVFVPKVVCRV